MERYNNNNNIFFSIIFRKNDGLNNRIVLEAQLIIDDLTREQFLPKIIKEKEKENIRAIAQPSIDIIQIEGRKEYLLICEIRTKI